MDPAPPPPPGSIVRKNWWARQNRNTRIILVIVALVIIGAIAGAVGQGSSGSGGAGSGAHTITYRVTGVAAASITYENANQDTGQEDATLPWTYSFTAVPGEFLYVSGQNQADSGSITCEVLVDGVVAESNSSSGAYVICTASGRL